MSRLLIPTAAAAALFLAAPTFAFDVENQDNVAYRVTIAVDDGGPSTKTVAPGKALKDVCEDICTIQLDTGEGAGKFVSIISTQKAVIRNGRISVQPRG